MGSTISYIRDVLQGPDARDYRKNTERVYEVKGVSRRRELQFLEPKLFCYAFPQHFGVSSPSMQQKLDVHVINAGGRASYNTVVKVVKPNNISLFKQNLTLQPGETKTLNLLLNNNDLIQGYQIICFDPLHDPVSSALIPLAKPGDGNYLINANSNPPTNWHAYSSIGGLMRPVPFSRTWQIQNRNPTPAQGALPLGPGFARGYFATRSVNMLPGVRNYSAELHQELVLSSLNFTPEFNRFLSNGDLLASLQAFVHVEETPIPAKAKIRVDFFDHSNALIKNFETSNPSVPGVWQRQTAAISIPAQTAKIVFRLIAAKIVKSNSGNAYFDALHLSITHRNVFYQKGLI